MRESADESRGDRPVRQVDRWRIGRNNGDHVTVTPRRRNDSSAAPFDRQHRPPGGHQRGGEMQHVRLLARNALDGADARNALDYIEEAEDLSESDEQIAKGLGLLLYPLDVMMWRDSAGALCVLVQEAADRTASFRRI
jgi:hypothetical protein